MSTQKTTLFAMSALAFAALAFAAEPLFTRVDAKNVVAARLDGTWTLDVEATRRNEPDPKATYFATLRFTYDDSIRARLDSTNDEYSKREIYGSGLMTIEGKPQPFVLVGDHGNTKLVYYVARGDDYGESTVVNMNLSVARGRRGDQLFFGGDPEIDQGAAVYTRSDAIPLADKLKRDPKK